MMILKNSKNDWEFHEKLVREGDNPSNIAKAFRSDNIEEIKKCHHKIALILNKRLNHLYEITSFVNTENVSIIDYTKFFASIKCFKLLFLRKIKVNLQIETTISSCFVSNIIHHLKDYVEKLFNFIVMTNFNI